MSIPEATGAEVRYAVRQGTVYTLDIWAQVRYDKGMKMKLTPEERAARALDRADDARVAALYAEGAMGRAPVPQQVAEPTRYVVTQLPSAVAAQARAAKAAATRRRNRAAKKAG